MKREYVSSVVDETDSRVDALDPERAEIALLLLPAFVGIHAGLDDGGLGGAEGVLATAVKALAALMTLR
jgi:hypothetical protein